MKIEHHVIVSLDEAQLNQILGVLKQLTKPGWSPQSEMILQRIEIRARQLANIVKGKPCQVNSKED